MDAIWIWSRSISSYLVIFIFIEHRLYVSQLCSLQFYFVWSSKVAKKREIDPINLFTWKIEWLFTLGNILLTYEHFSFIHWLYFCKHLHVDLHLGLKIWKRFIHFGFMHFKGATLRFFWGRLTRICKKQWSRIQRWANKSFQLPRRGGGLE